MSGTSAVASGKRDDITLLVRNFNFPMPNAMNSPTGQVRFNPIVSMAPVATYEESTNDNEDNESEITTTNDEAQSTQDTTTTTDTSDVYPGEKYFLLLLKINIFFNG